MFDPNSLFNNEELTTPRTPLELSCWIDSKCRLLADHPEPKVKEWVLLRKRPFKKFYEEIYPLSLFANHLYTDCSDIKCIPNLDNKDFDATIWDHSTSPSSKVKVEITSAIDGQKEYLRMKHFIEHRSVSLWSKVSASGTERKGHKIEVEKGAIAGSVLLEQTFSLIKSAIKGKSVSPDNPQKYGQRHVLVVAFDDWWWFKPEQKMATLKAFMKNEVLTLPLNCAALYVVGLSGKTFMHFNC